MMMHYVVPRNNPIHECNFLSELKLRESLVHSCVEHAPVLIRPKAVRPVQFVQRGQTETEVNNVSDNNTDNCSSPSCLDRDEGARHPEPAEDYDIYNEEETDRYIAIMLDLFSKRSRDEDETTAYTSQRLFPIALTTKDLVQSHLIKPIALRAVDVAQNYRKYEGAAYPSAQSIQTKKTAAMDISLMRVCG